MTASTSTTVTTTTFRWYGMAAMLFFISLGGGCTKGSRTLFVDRPNPEGFLPQHHRLPDACSQLMSALTAAESSTGLSMTCVGRTTSSGHIESLDTPSSDETKTLISSRGT